MIDHEHNYWRTPGWALRCAVCGASRPVPELTAEQRAQIDRFGIFDEDDDALGIGESI